MKDRDMCIDRKEIIEILDDKLSGVNAKLDNIVIQTTKTNSRVDKLEDDVKNIRIQDAGRYESCPQAPTIYEIVRTLNTVNDSLIGQRELRNILLKAITITGIFFTILFSLIAIILRFGDLIMGI